MKYVLYHANCYDGFGAAFAAWLKYSDSATYIPVQYGHGIPEMQPDSVVFIVDFSYDAKTLLSLAAQHEAVFVLDHHASAQADLNNDAFLALGAKSEIQDGWIEVNDRLSIMFDMHLSGAMLAWNFFHPDELAPLLIRYLQDRDLWLFEMPNSKSVSAFLQSMPMVFECWKDIMSDLQTQMGAGFIFGQGDACLRFKEQQVALMARNHRWATFNIKNKTISIIVFSMGPCIPGLPKGQPFHADSGDIHVVPCSNATVFFSEVGDKLLEIYGDAKFSAYYLDRSDGNRQWGLRSRKDFDCSIVARAFGGGGHKQAAGFTEKL